VLNVASADSMVRLAAAYCAEGTENVRYTYCAVTLVIASMCSRRIGGVERGRVEPLRGAIEAATQKRVAVEVARATATVARPSCSRFRSGHEPATRQNANKKEPHPVHCLAHHTLLLASRVQCFDEVWRGDAICASGVNENRPTISSSLSVAWAEPFW
jgi:hypothetical protein